MMSALKDMIPGAEAWPRFERNRVEQFEARFSMVECPSRRRSSSPAWPAVACRWSFRTVRDAPSLPRRHNRRAPSSPCATSTTSGQPTKSIRTTRTARQAGVTGFTTADGRFSIMMPHPERVFRSVQMSWHPADWEARGWHDSPWLRMFRNARRWVAWRRGCGVRQRWRTKKNAGTPAPFPVRLAIGPLLDLRLGAQFGHEFLESAPAAGADAIAA
jgi:phosphoribosylformylglycinamidine synthase